MLRIFLYLGCSRHWADVKFLFLISLWATGIDFICAARKITYAEKERQDKAKSRTGHDQGPDTAHGIGDFDNDLGSCVFRETLEERTACACYNSLDLRHRRAGKQRLDILEGVVLVNWPADSQEDNSSDDLPYSELEK